MLLLSGLIISENQGGAYTSWGRREQNRGEGRTLGEGRTREIIWGWI